MYDVHSGSLEREGSEQHSFSPSTCTTALKSFAGSPTESVGTSDTAAATDDDEENDGEHVQCEMCHVWQHYECFFSHTRHPSLACIKCLLDKVNLENHSLAFCTIFICVGRHYSSYSLLSLLPFHHSPCHLEPLSSSPLSLYCSSGWRR